MRTPAGYIAPTVTEEPSSSCRRASENAAHRELAQRVRDAPGGRGQRVDAREVRDVRGGRRAQRREQCLGDRHRAPEVHVGQPAHLLHRQLVEVAEHRGAGAGDQRVDARVRGGDLGARREHGLVVAEIDDVRGRSCPLSSAATAARAVRVVVDQREVHAAAASRRAMSAPMPLAAPVITVVLPGRARRFILLAVSRVRVGRAQAAIPRF